MGPQPADAEVAEDEVDLLTEFRRAVAQDLRGLAALHNAEPDASLLRALREAEFPAGLGLKLGSKLAREGLDALQKALAEIDEVSDTRVIDELAADYADIYLSYTLRASPYESVWLDDEGLERQQPMFQVRDHYSRHGLVAADWRRRADDHLVLQLQFIAYLLDPDTASASENDVTEAACFMDEHLLLWLPQFSERVAARSATRFFAGLALTTAAYCDELRDLLAEILDEPRPSPEQMQERMQPQAGTEDVPVPYVPGMGPTL